jgi:hypothetical protein
MTSQDLPGCSDSRDPTPDLCGITTKSDCNFSPTNRVVTTRTITWAADGSTGSGTLDVTSTVNGVLHTCMYSATYSR